MRRPRLDGQSHRRNSSHFHEEPQAPSLYKHIDPRDLNCAAPLCANSAEIRRLRIARNQGLLPRVSLGTRRGQKKSAKGSLAAGPAPQFPRVVREMNSNHRVLGTAYAVVAVGTMMLAVGCGHYGEEGKPEDYKSTGSGTRWVAGSGSTSIDPLMDRWSSDYEKSHPVH